MYMSLRNHVTESPKTPKVSKDSTDPKDSATENLLFTLPRELRNKIYRNVLCSKYLICWPNTWEKGKAVSHVDRPLLRLRRRQFVWRAPWSGHHTKKIKRLFWADIALLLTSKAISHEGMEIMYQESWFSGYVGQSPESKYRFTPLPSQQILERIQNLEMSMCMCNSWNHLASGIWLTYSETMRQTCRISLCCYDCLDKYRHAIFEACHFCIGFRVVTLTLDLDDMDGGNRTLMELHRSIRENFRDSLEPHLGHSRSYEIGNVLALDFHPRKHIEVITAERNERMVLRRSVAAN